MSSSVCIKANVSNNLKLGFPPFIRLLLLCEGVAIFACCLLGLQCPHPVANSWLLLGTEDKDSSWAVRTAGMCPRLSITGHTGSWALQHLTTRRQSNVKGPLLSNAPDGFWNLLSCWSCRDFSSHHNSRSVTVRPHKFILDLFQKILLICHHLKTHLMQIS